MAGYSFLAQIRDRATFNAVKSLIDRVTQLEGQAADIGTLSAPLTDHLDASSHRLTKLAPPVAATDAVTLRFLQTYVEARLAQANLIDASGQALGPPADTDAGQTAAGVTAAGADGHPSVTGLTAYNAGLIIGGTAYEFASLTAAAPDQPTRTANQLELLLRTIWHLSQFGFTTGRQRNPSGVLSGDKLCVISDGQMRAFDIFTGGTFDTALGVHAIQVFPPNLVADAGTAD